jgi:hypothetical protein
VFEDDCLTGCCTMWGLDEGSKYLWNVGKFIPDNTPQHLRRET